MDDLLLLASDFDNSIPVDKLRANILGVVRSIAPSAEVRVFDGSPWEAGLQSKDPAARVALRDALRQAARDCVFAVARYQPSATWSSYTLGLLANQPLPLYVVHAYGADVTTDESSSSTFADLGRRYEDTISGYAPPVAFVSYVHEDAVKVDELCRALQLRGVTVWRDRDYLQPGDRWKDRIREAIEKGSAFVACFSTASTSRSRTYMYEELTLAIDEIRKRPRDRAWFFPVRLDDAEVPAIPVSAGETLLDIHSLQLADDSPRNIDVLADAIRALRRPRHPRERQGSHLHSSPPETS